MHDLIRLAQPNKKKRCAKRAYFPLVQGYIYQVGVIAANGDEPPWTSLYSTRTRCHREGADMRNRTEGWLEAICGWTERRCCQLVVTFVLLGKVSDSNSE